MLQPSVAWAGGGVVESISSCAYDWMRRFNEVHSITFGHRYQLSRKLWDLISCIITWWESGELEPTLIPVIPLFQIPALTLDLMR